MLMVVLKATKSSLRVIRSVSEVVGSKLWRSSPAEGRLQKNNFTPLLKSETPSLVSRLEFISERKVSMAVLALAMFCLT